MNETEIYDTDPGAPARFREEELQRLDVARRRRQVFTFAPIDPVYRDGTLKAMRGRLSLFMSVLPISRIDKTCVNPDELIGKTIPVTVEQLPTRRSELVVSHKGALEQLRGELFRSLHAKCDYDGVVHGIGHSQRSGEVEFGVFVDLGHKLCGLVHVSTLPAAVRPPSQHFRPGQPVRVTVLRRRRDKEGKMRIELRIKHEE